MLSLSFRLWRRPQKQSRSILTIEDAPMQQKVAVFFELSESRVRYKLQQQQCATRFTT